MTARALDLGTWPRREHFRFFREYDDNYFNICAEVDVTALLGRARAPEGPSFFLSSLHRSLGAANDIEEFRYRIRGDGVVVHDVIHGGSTILRDDGTFGFGYFTYDPDFPRFAAGATEVLAAARASSGALEPRPERDDLLHYSVIPWVSFTSFSHARRWGTDDSVPKVVFGGHRRSGRRRKMPVSVEVHHALMDGLHVGRFFERFQQHLDDPDKLDLTPPDRSAPS